MLAFRTPTCSLMVLLFAAWMTPRAAHADLVISIGNATITSGSTQAFVDVTVSGTLPPNPVFPDFPDFVAIFDLTFSITPSGGPLDLVFSSPGVGPEAYHTNDTNYIFYDDPVDPDGVSENVVNGFSATSVFSPNEIQVGDALDFNAPLIEVEVNNMSSFLLTRLAVELPGLSTTADYFPGTEFVISLDENASSFTDGFGFSPEISNLSSSGTVTIQGTAVPEPGSLAFLGLLAVGCSWRSRRQRKTDSQPAAV